MGSHIKYGIILLNFSSVYMYLSILCESSLITMIYRTGPPCATLHQWGPVRPKQLYTWAPICHLILAIARAIYYLLEQSLHIIQLLWTSFVIIIYAESISKLNLVLVTIGDGMPLLSSPLASTSIVDHEPSISGSVELHLKPPGSLVP